MKRITALILLIVLVVTAIPVYADEQVVNGYIKDTETGEITGLSHDTLAKGSPDASSNKISIAFFGDSIMAGRDGRYLVTPREGASPGSYMTLVSESEQIPGVIESMLPDNYECFNYGLGGTGYINQGTSYSALSNIKGRDLSNMDYVVICYGSNDYSPIFYKMDKTTQCSQEVIKKNLAIYRAQIEACLDAISGPEIILVAPWRHIGNGLENWALKSIDPMVKEIAEARGITYISQSSCPLQSGAFSDGTDSDVMGATSLYNNKPQYHPSSDGYAILGEWLFEQIEDIVVPPAPEITLNGLNDNGFIKSSSELSLSINAPSFDKAVITINGETTEIQETSYQFNFGEAENTETGTYEIEVTAYNKVGAYATENYIVKLDNYSPRATITGVTKEFYSEDVSVGKSVEEANIDSISFTMNNEETEGKKVTEEGNYSIYLEVTDKAGNASTDEKSFVIDKTNPVVAISGDYNGFAKALSDITVNTEDSNIDNVIIKIKKGEEIVKTLNGGESITLEDIEGEESDNTSYTLNIEATDKAGNKTTLSKDIHIDNKLPDISFNINKEYYNEPVTIEVTTGEENVESITVSVTKDGENIGDVRNLTEDGSYTVKAVITDIVGNTYEREVSFVIDTRIPTVSLAGDKNGFVKSLDEVSIEAKDDNLNTTMTKVYLGEELVKTFHGTPTTLEGIETPENDTTVYVIKVTALDKAGNETKEEYKITVDNKDPDIKFNVNDKAFLNKAVSIEVTTSEENVEEIILTGTFNGEKITDLSNLEADGEYTAKATIIDKIGNSTKKEISFTIDTTKPEVNLEGLNENGYVKSLDELTVIASDTNYDGMTVDVTKEESLKVYETNEIELNIETLDDRNVDSEEYTVSVTAKDKAGNIAQKDFKVMRDNSAPRIKFDGTEEDAIYNEDVDLKAVITDGSTHTAIMKVMLNGEELDGEDISVHLTEEGMYEATATSVDKAGNTSSESIKFYIDKTDPIATISGVKSNEHYQEVPEITIESNEEGIIHYEIIRNGESILVKESNNTVTYSDFKEDGSYQVVAYAVDKAGNKGSKTSQMFIKDTVSPTIELSGTSSGSYNNTNVSVNVRIVEENHEANNVSVVITRDGESETLGFNSSGVDSENVYTFKEDGFYVVAVSSIDKAGNQAETKSISFTIDTVNPVTTITGLAEGTHYRSVPEVKQEMNEEGALYIKAVRDGEEIYNGSDITKIDFSNDGNYTITGYSVDLAGNKSETLSYSFIKDSTAPIIILSGVEEGSYYNEDKEVKISVTERYFETNNVYVTVTRNGESSSNTFTSDGVISEMVIPFTNDGHYTVTVESTDKAGNSAASKEISFTVDKTLPLTAISGIEEGKHYQVVPTITGTANEDGTVFIKVVRDGAVIHEGEGKKEITFSDFKEDGDYEVTMYTIDLAGNKGEEVISKFVKDSTAPVLTLSGIEDKAISNVVGGVNLKVVERYFDKANVEVVLTRELNGKTVQVPVTVNLAGETTDIIIPLEEDGNYKLTVKTTDEAGNVSEEKTLTFTIDRTKPVVKITIPSLENGYYDVIDLRVLIEDDFFDSKEITLTKSGVGVVDFRNSESFNEKGGERVYEDFQKIKENDGVYTIIVKAKDKGGNETIEELTFVVDRFGSVFVIKKAPEVKYMKELKSAIVIEEINVAKTVSYDIFIHRDSDTKNAEGVKVEKNGNTTTYTIPVTNFIEEGIYRVDIITKDSAGNVSELKSDASSGIWFAIDKTAPIIAYNGLKDGETYIADYIDLYIGAQDTISPDVMLTAFIDGKEVEIKKDKQGKAYITVESGMNKTIEIKAVDTAGNEAIEQIKNVTISTNPVVRTYSNKPLMAGILGGLALLIGALIFFLLKRKKDEEGTDDIEF